MMAGAAGRCWATRSGRCRVRTSGKRWARSPPPGEELSDVCGLGRDGCEVRRFCSFLVLDFCWWGWTLRDLGRDGWCAGRVLSYAVNALPGSSCVYASEESSA